MLKVRMMLFEWFLEPLGIYDGRTKKNANEPKFQNWENLEFFTSFRFSNCEAKCLNVGILGQEVPTF